MTFHSRKNSATPDLNLVSVMQGPLVPPLPYQLYTFTDYHSFASAGLQCYICMTSGELVRNGEFAMRFGTQCTQTGGGFQHLQAVQLLAPLGRLLIFGLSDSD